MELIASLLLLGFACATLAGAARYLLRQRHESKAASGRSTAFQRSKPLGKGVAIGIGLREAGAAGAAVLLLAPLLAGALLPLPVMLGLGFVTAAAGLLQVLRLGWLRLAWPVAGALLVYGCAGIVRVNSPPDAVVLGSYSLALTGLALLLTWEAAQHTARELQVREQRHHRAAWALGLLLALGAVLLAAGFALRSGHAPASIAALLAALAGIVTAGCMRPGLAPLALPAGLVAALLLAAWPTAPGILLDLNQISAAAAFGLICSVGGGVMAVGSRAHVWGAVLAGFGPLLALAIVTPAGVSHLSHPWWGLCAIALSGLNLLAFARSPRPHRARDREVFGYAAAVAMLAGLTWAGVLTFASPAAVSALAAAILGLRLASPALRNSAGVLAVAAALAGVNRLAGGSWSDWLLAGISLADALLAAVAVWLASRVLGATRMLGAERAAEAAVIVLALCGLLSLAWLPPSLLGGDQTLAFLGLQAFALLSGAGMLARLPPRGLSAATRLWGERALFGLAAVYTGLATLSVVNPWWGMQPPPVPGWPILNPLLAGYLAPGVMFGLYARLKRSQDSPKLAAVASGVSAGLIGLWGLLEARRFLTGEVLARNPEAMPLMSLLGAATAIALSCAIVALVFGPPVFEADRMRRLLPKSAQARDIDPNLAPPA